MITLEGSAFIDNGHSSCYWACKGLQAYKALKGILGLLEVTKDYRQLQRITGGYKGLLGVTEGTRGYREL